MAHISIDEEALRDILSGGAPQAGERKAREFAMRNGPADEADIALAVRWAAENAEVVAALARGELVVRLSSSNDPTAPVKKTCDKCGKPFFVGKGTGRRASANYCSERCRKAAWAAKNAK